MKRNLILLISATLCQLVMFGQNSDGPRAGALGSSAVALQDVWSALNNQAGLISLQGISGALYYENRFMIKNLSQKGIAFGLPMKNSAVGISFRSFGYQAYIHSKAGLAYALRLSQKFAAGVQVSYHSIRIAEGYGSSESWSVEGGVNYNLNENVIIAAHLTNPTRAKVSDFNDERLPTILKFGAAYRFSSNLQLMGEIRKSSEFNPQISCGIEYWVVKSLALRVGYNSNPSKVSVGFGWKFKTWQFDASSNYHSILGFSPQLSLTYSAFSNKENEKPY